ncbi:unnamed protein product [Microthlaspi erraticum]|uniref:Uncharacterized protein n=1 Tax=Microthlaspi erraticum TaxID=1685480 RepID=A0A6D2JL79_9BRAS|nr:unnamed protein product [Microthlaspi erraticum]
MRIEGEKGVKTQSAPNQIGRDAQRNFGRDFHRDDRSVEPGRNGRARPDYARHDRARTRTEETARSADFRIGTDRPCRSIRETSLGLGRNSLGQNNLADQIARPRQNPSAIGPNFSRPRWNLGTPMAKTKGNESMKKKKNPFMEPPKKQIKLGSSSSNARAAIPTSPHSIDAIKNMWRVQEEEKMIGHL